jgi:hypothetical protein
VLAEITEKDLKPGDLVGELASPNAPSATAFATAEMANAQKAGRAGGPTTLFGGSDWGPYSDGPLNAVRKSLLNRNGLNEKNRMFVATQRKRRQRQCANPSCRYLAVSLAGGAHRSSSMDTFRMALSEHEQARGIGARMSGTSSKRTPLRTETGAEPGMVSPPATLRAAPAEIEC